MGVVTRLFGWLVPERELTVEPRFHPYYPGEAHVCETPLGTSANAALGPDGRALLNTREDGHQDG